MPYKILPTKEFEKDFKKLDRHFQKKIKKKLEEIGKSPERYKHLHYDLAGSCSVRIEKLRVLFSYNEVLQELYLEKVIFGHRYRE